MAQRSFMAMLCGVVTLNQALTPASIFTAGKRPSALAGAGWQASHIQPNTPSRQANFQDSAMCWYPKR